MAATSFREILNQFLEEKSTDSATPTEGKPEVIAQQHDFQWQAPGGLFRRKSTYQPPPPRQKTPEAKPALEVKPAPPKQKPLEPEWNLSKFSSHERECVTKLVELGAFELRGKQTISRPILKRAHRRLVKLHHPDVLLKVVNENERARRKETFLKLQSAYETLYAKLNSLSAKACDSESASESESQHQDAA
jgi:hypothetical protein